MATVEAAGEAMVAAGAARPRLILASASPRRLEILRSYGHQPEVFFPDIDEQIDTDLSLDALPAVLEHLALAKAEAVVRQLKSGGLIDKAEAAIVIAADTVVYADGIMGKPNDHDHAVEMLLRLKSRTHTVVTAVGLIELPTDRVSSSSDMAHVTFVDYDLEQINQYIKDEPPFDKAGAYAIQGIWGSQVLRLEGDIETVIGLPYRLISGVLDDLSG